MIFSMGSSVKSCSAALSLLQSKYLRAMKVQIWLEAFTEATEDNVEEHFRKSTVNLHWALGLDYSLIYGYYCNWN